MPSFANFEFLKLKVMPIILCGGEGSRLWPLSRQNLPKQFVKLKGELSLFQLAVQQVTGPSFHKPLIVTSGEFELLVIEQLEQCNVQGKIILEPSSKNTAAAIFFALLHLWNEGYRGQILVTPSDHLITDPFAISEAVLEATANMTERSLVTFGIVPDRVETGYGYLNIKQLDSSIQTVEEFQEKPEHDVAKEMVASGNWLWNSGIYLFSIEPMLEFVSERHTNMFRSVKSAVTNMNVSGNLITPQKEAWADIQNISFDKAVTEIWNELICLKFRGFWSDVGNWLSFSELVTAKKIEPPTGVALTTVDCEGSSFFSWAKNIQIVGVGLSDIIVVATNDAVLVLEKSSAQMVKFAKEIMNRNEVIDVNHASKSYRPWGWYDVLCQDSSHKVKKILVKPGKRLSLQSHKFRSENWVVVTGKATIDLDGENYERYPGQSIEIKCGQKHRLANDGEQDLLIVEVQTGDYFGEDDIIRYSDDYGRN